MFQIFHLFQILLKTRGKAAAKARLDWSFVLIGKGRGQLLTVNFAESSSWLPM